MFHIYLTVISILFEIGGIHSKSALPGDRAFSHADKNYDAPRLNEYLQNLEFHRARTSASKKVIFTVSGLFSFILQIWDRQKLQTLILVITSSVMRVKKPLKAI